MSVKKIWHRTFILLFILLVVGNIEAYGDEKKQILFISSYNPNFISFNDQIAGIQDETGDTELQIEYMDFRTFSDYKNEENFYNLLKYKISSYDDFDAIILGDDKALRFGMEYKDELFKDIPMVFLGVSNAIDMDRAINDYGMYGVAEIYSIEDTLKTALELNKGSKNVVFLDGSSTDNIENDIFKNIDEDMIKEYVLKYPDKNFKTIYSNNITYEEFIYILKSFTKNDIVISVYPYFFSDENKITYKDLVKLMSDNVKDDVPIYGILTYGIGEGFLGGKVVSHYTQGKEAGIIVNKLLNGETSKDISVISSDINEYVFDYNKLRVMKIKESELPEGSIIVNKPESFFKKYKILILPVSFTILGLFVIIVALIIYSIDQKRYEKEILKAKSIAETANKSKDHFISNISHELRTPVAVIISANQLLKLKINKYNLEEKENITEKLNIIDKNCYRLMRLVNNIIDIAKIDANFMRINLKNLNAVELLEDLVMSVIPYAENKNVNIIFDTEEEEVLMALDKEKIERIVLNLLSNAIKFSNEGGSIFFNVYLEENNLVFYVLDNGIGIEKKDLEKIFGKFIQVDETMTRKNEGSGIGLSIVKSFVELHKGRIYVESEPKNGSKFTVKLPITLVDDNSDLRDIKNATEGNNSKINTTVEFSDIYF